MHEKPRILIAADHAIAIRSLGDISEVIGICMGAQGLILTEQELAEEFFDLRTGLAGELFQKFITYRVRVAIVVANPEAFGERFRELAHEHASHSLVRILRSTEEAKSWLEAL